jgi:iron complex outermembrane receptor protein
MALHSPTLHLPAAAAPSRPTRLALAIALLSSASAWAQTQPVPELTITDSSPSQVSGFADVSPSKAPFSATVIGQQTLQDIGAQRVSDALRLDASVSDAYNSPAYWDILSVRGYTLDNRYNYRREGLPISAETMIGMENKERIELFKGTSGIQAGTSAPGGLVNYVVKRAPNSNQDAIRTLTASYGNGRSASLGLDLGGRFGQDEAWGYRFNAVQEHLNPYIQNTQGHRNLLALAMDWRLSADTRLEWEFENSHREQIGVNAYSLQGQQLPAPVDGKLNITRQPWSPPGVFDGQTGSVRLKQSLDKGWLWTTQYGAQRLRTDDRLTFAYGCSAENAWDRYCSNGSFDLYDYRSENERRLSDALQTELSGQWRVAGMRHDVGIILMRQRQLDRLSSMQAYNWAGTGSVSGVADAAAAPAPSDYNTNRSEYATELALRDRMQLNAQTAVWLGLRHTRIGRESVRTDGSRLVNDQRHFNTPWVAATVEVLPGTVAYASYGEGIESEVAPNRSRYTNAGQALPALRSHQREAGLKGQNAGLQWQATWFDIVRPVSADAGVCDDAGPCTRQIDGQAHHRGLELASRLNRKDWSLDMAATWLDAVRENASIDPTVNGQRPLNVPRWTLRTQAQYRFSQTPGLRAWARLSHEGARSVTEDASIQLPAWTTLDLGTHYDTRVQGLRTEWTAGIDNLLDKHYWRESPKQFGHYYLYPGAPRTLRLTLRTHF